MHAVITIHLDADDCEGLGEGVQALMRASVTACPPPAPKEAT